MIWQSLRGAAHVYVAVACGFAALAWRRPGTNWLIERSQAHYDTAQLYLGWMDDDGFDYD